MKYLWIIWMYSMYSKCELHTFTLHCAVYPGLSRYPKTRCFFADTGLHRPSPAFTGWEAHLATNCDPPVGTGRQSHPNAVNLQLRANRWWLQAWRRWKLNICQILDTKKNVENNKFINVLTILNLLNIPLSTWGQNTNLPSTSVLPCSALANVEISGNPFGSCRCHVHSSLRMRIGEPTVQLST